MSYRDFYHPVSDRQAGLLDYTILSERDVWHADVPYQGDLFPYDISKLLPPRSVLFDPSLLPIQCTCHCTACRTKIQHRIGQLDQTHSVPPNTFS